MDIRVAVFAGALWLTACAQSPPAIRAPETAILLSHDDGRADADIAFPDGNHEALIRFDLPAGARGGGRLWFAAKAAGVLTITVYSTSALDGPGEPLTAMDCTISPGAVSSGSDGRFLRQELGAPDRLPQTIWIGFRRAAGAPMLWSSSKDHGTYFVRKHSAAGTNTGFGLMPVRKTPIVRLDLTQPGS